MTPTLLRPQRFAPTTPVVTYSSTILADSPLAYYRLGELAIATTATSSTNFSSEPPANAIDGSPTTFWTTNGFSSGWLRLQMSSAVVSTRYIIARRDDIPNRNPKDWTLEGSNDGSSWTTLDTRSGITWPTTGEVKAFTFSNSTAYLYYRLNISANNGDTYLSVAEFHVMPATDSSGNSRDGYYAGTLTAAQTGLVNGDTDTAVVFGGGRMVVPSAPWLNSLTAITVEAIVKTTVSGTGVYQQILNQDVATGSTQRRFQFRINTSNKLEAIVFNSSGSPTTATGNTVLATNTKYHVAFTWDGSTIRIYVNGALDATASLSSIYTTAVTQPLIMGSDTFNVSTWAGTIDEVAIYGTALTAAKLVARSALAFGGYLAAVLADAPLAYYRSADGGTGIFADSSGNARDGAYANSFQTLAQPSITGDASAEKCVNWSGGRGEISYASGWMNPTVITLEAWVKYTGGAFNPGIISRWGNTGGGSNWMLQLQGATPRFTFVVGSTTYTLDAAQALITNAVYHIAATWDGTTAKIYLNGVLSNSSTPTTGNLATATCNLQVGSANVGTNSFAGYMAEVGIYGSALSAARILAHYVAGFAAGAFSSVVDTAVTGDSPWAYWNCGELNGPILADKSGNGRHMTVIGAATSYRSDGPGAKGSKSISWPSSASSENYAMGNLTHTTSAYTVEAWVYLTANPSNSTPIVGTADSYGGSTTDKYLYVDSSGRVNWQVYNGSSQVLQSSALALNVWHHIAASVGSGGQRLRIDKAATASNGAVTSSYTGAAQMPFIHGGGSGYTDGGAVVIGPCAIWLSQLTTAQNDAHCDAVGPFDPYGAALYAKAPLTYVRFADASQPASGSEYIDSMGVVGRGAVQAPSFSGLNQTTSLLTKPGIDKGVTTNGGRWATIPYGSWMDGNNFTISLMMNAGSSSVVFCDRDSGTNLTSVWRLWRNGFTLTWSCYSGSTRTDVASGTSQFTGTVYHVAASLNGTAMTLYLNGTSVGTGTLSGPLNAPGAQGILLGGSGGAYVGVLDEVSYHSPGLSSAEIAAIAALR